MLSKKLFWGIIPVALVALTLVFFAFIDKAGAVPLPPPSQGSPCPGQQVLGSGSLCLDHTTCLPVQGFSTQMVYCVRTVLIDALNGTNNSGTTPINPGYLTQVITILDAYKWAAITLAISLFGVKLVTLGVEEVLKEGASLIFRIAIVLFLIENLNGSNLYTSVTGNGLYAALADTTDELVSIVGSVLTTPGGLPVGCTSPPPPLPAVPQPAAYAVWQGLDCMFGALFGLSTNPNALISGVVIIIGASIFSGGLAIFAAIMAISLLVSLLLLLMRALYTVLLSYFVLALLILIGPLIIPLRVFDNEYTKEIVWKWIGLIFSTIFQPMFIIGFLSFILLTEMLFMNGLPPNNHFPGCVIDSANLYYNEAKGGSADPRNPGNSSMVIPGGGIGPCSFKEMWNASCSGDPKNCTHREPLFSLELNVRFPNLKMPGCSCTCDGWPNHWVCCASCALGNVGALIAYGVGTALSWLAEVAQNFINWLSGLLFSVNRLIHFPLKQFFVTVCAFLMINSAFKRLLTVVPHLARSIGLIVGLGLVELAQVPFENAIRSTVKGAQNGMKKAMNDAKATGSRRPGIMGIMRGGIAGAGKSLWDNTVK